MKINTEQLIKVIDFWQKSVKSEDLIERAVLDEIDFKTKEVIDIIGSRRSGKSSLLKLIISRQKIKDSSFYINFEDPVFIEQNSPQIIEEIISIFKEYFNKNLKYVFFDEIQEINQWEKAIRKLRDAEELKIFITGSSSKLLGKELATLLTGRHLTHTVHPLSFSEFVRFSGVKAKKRKDAVLQENLLFKLFGEYINIGGFPEAVLTKNEALLKQYFFDILEKDVMAKQEIREKKVLEKIAIYLLSNSGKIISLESIKAAFHISFAAAAKYLEYLKEAFLIFELPQFSFSLKKQQKAQKKIYSIDCGLSRAVSFRFSEDKGRVLENIVFMELSRRYQELYYYKTKNNLEIDFLAKESAQIKELIQVCWSLADEKTREREIRNLTAGMDELGLKEGLILTHQENDILEYKGKKIIIMPVYRWLLNI